MSNKRRMDRYLALLFFLWFSIHQTGTGQTYLQADSAAISASWFDQGNIHLIGKEWDPALQAYKNALQYASGELRQARIH
ncbi:MAG: hypothetical protein HQ542_12080, partial [Bacteroidia bacterium]|nr:hypothetical protein [Bacteroidia bacterium]